MKNRWKMSYTQSYQHYPQFCGKEKLTFQHIFFCKIDKKKILQNVSLFRKKYIQNKKLTDDNSELKVLGSFVIMF